MNKFTGLVRRCIDDYAMIEDGDTVAVGVSGGKDSLSLLCALANLRPYYPKRFALRAVTIDMGFDGVDLTPVQRLCDELSVPYTILKKPFAEIIFTERDEKNPCSLCAKMRRGALNDIATELGANRLALAHNHDDAVETFFLSLLYEGRINCFSPVTYMSRADVTQIRPMLYAGEDTIKRLVKRYNLPVVHNPCPMNGESKREEIKTLVKTLGETYPALKNKVFGAMQRLPLDKWQPRGNMRRPAP